MSVPVRAHGGGLETRLSKLEEKQRTGELTRYTVATVPAANSAIGCMIYVSNGAAGSPVMAFSDGTNWLRCDTLANIS